MAEAMARERFAAIARAAGDTIDLLEAALWIAAEEYDGLDVAAYRRRVDALAAEARPALAGAASGRERVERLNHYLFVERGFTGNRRDYADPRNSFLNQVLDRCTGIPITLTLVYMEVARRLDMRVEGVSFPMHFLGKYVGDEEILIDAFSGRILSRRECEALLRAALGHAGARLEPQHLAAAHPREILARVIRNLKQIYIEGGDYERARACCDRLLLLAPDDPGELRDRGVVHEQLGFHAAAEADLARCLALAPDDPAAPALRRLLALARQRAGPVH